MLIQNTGAALVVMNLRNGEQYRLPAGQTTSVPDSKISMIDDSAVLIALFNAGVLVAFTDAGAAYSGFPTVASTADSKVIPPVDPEYAAAVVGAVSGARLGQRWGTAEIWQAGSGIAPWSNNTNATTTWQMQFACRGKPYAVQIGYMNPTTSAYTVDKTAITGSTTYVANGDPTGGQTPVNVLFSGAAAAVVPAAASGGNEFILSDWTPIQPIDRTDVVGGYYLEHIRSYIALANHPYGSSSGSSAGYPGNVAAGLIRMGSFTIADRIATPTGYVLQAGSSGFHLPMSVSFRGLDQCIQVMAIGDSLTGNQPATDGGEYNSLHEKAVNILNAASASSAYFWSLQNLGFGGQTFAAFNARLAKALASYSPDVVVLPVWGPNSNISTQAGFDASMATLLDSIERVKAKGASVVLWTATPKNTISAADDAWRKLANTAARNLASAGIAVVADLDLLVSDGASPAQWISTYSSDGLHFNSAGTTYVAATMAAAIKRASPIRSV